MDKFSTMVGKAVDFLNLWVSEPYFFSHFLVFFSYIAVRWSTSHSLSPDISHHFLRRDIQAILGFLVIFVVKLTREDTWEAFISDSLFYMKIFLLAVSFMYGRQLALVHAMALLVINIVTQQPAFQHLGESIKLTPLQLEALLTDGNPSRFWLVEFRSLSSSACVRVSRCIPELSITYSNKNVSFGVVDLGLFPNAAEKFGISLNGGKGELPAYILFDGSSEIARFPEWNRQYHGSLTKAFLARHFELDRFLLCYVRAS